MYLTDSHCCVLRVDAPRFNRVTADASGHDQRQYQDRLARYLSWPVDSGAGSSRFRSDEAEDGSLPPPLPNVDSKC
jgi:hypothetical protein